MKGSRRLSTLHVTGGATWGGREMQTLALAAGLAAKGHRQVIAAIAGSPVARRAALAGIEVLSLPPGIAGRLLALRRAAAAAPWDTTHLHDVPSLKDLGRACVGRATPRRVLTVRGDVAYGDRVLPAGTPMRKVDHFVAVSEWVWSALVRAGIEEERITVVHTAVDLARFTRNPGQMQTLRGAARVAMGLAEDEFVVGTVLRLTAAKGVEHLIEAVRKIRAKETPPGDERMRLVVVGEGPHRTALEEAARSRGLGGAVLFTGWRDDVTELLAAFDLYAHPAVTGGAFPVAMREAMAMTVPVVATDLTGIREIIDNGKHGLIVPTADPGALALNIMKCRRDPEMARRMGRAGNLKVQRYGLQAMVDRTEEVYFRLAR